MPREVPDDEYAYLQGRRQVADFVESIYNDPTLSKEAKRLIKKKYPNLPIPDLDIEDRVEARLADDRRKRDDEENAKKRKTEEDGWKEQRSRTQKEYGFTDEGMTDLEKMMVERNIGDYEVAATYHAARNPKPSAPTAQHGQPWRYQDNDTFREIAKDPEAWGRGELMKALKNDEDRTRGRTF